MKIIISSLPSFRKKAEKALSDKALQELVDHLTLHPEAGDVMQGTGGFRKLRWATGKGGGKSGGVRIIYLYHQKHVLLILVDLFKKADKASLDAGEKAELKKLAPLLLERYRKELNQ